MAYKIAFLGSDERATRYHFREFAEANRDQVRLCNLTYGIIALNDGTEIYRAHLTPEWVKGRRFDQIIIADDHRAPHDFIAALAGLYCACAGSIVPEEFWEQFYDPDAYRKGETCESYL